MSNLRTLALQAAREPAALLAEAFASGTVVAETKTNRHDLVSAWDHRVEEMLKTSLTGHDAVFWGEETGRQSPARSGQLEWIIDPIDGTSNFVHGYPMFSISIAAAIDNAVVAGVVVNPVTGTEYSADASGAYCNGERIVARPAPAHEAQYNLITSFPAAEVLHRAPDASTLFGDLVTNFATVRRIVSGALELCHAACGIADVVLGVDTQPWDVAAGSYILHQAGGRYITAVDGPPHLARHYLALAPDRSSEGIAPVFEAIHRL
ncbi:inositol monophosphatase family protein [Yaniella halotolerans]|uniref:inositol monophosphatase family protein n=1 Tax=Yaniella halotolerans TaxID=225453 RepID=UPI0003B5B071|nr:inositol monophosphatase family protein [Yaniella halotolerans]